MAALSRNTASVAQDFHNAGGGVKPTFNNRHELCKTTTTMTITKQHSITSIEKRPYPNGKLTSNCVSSPASNSKIQQTNNNLSSMTTKNRHISSPEKENIYVLCEDKSIKTIHDNSVNNSLKLKRPRPELQIANESIWFETKSAEKRNRKQSQPRKIPINTFADDGTTATSSQLVVERCRQQQSKENGLLDKHLLKMVSRKRSCNICPPRNQFMTMPYHTKSSLILHKLWRHSCLKCMHLKCGRQFNMQYKLRMHIKLMHNIVKRKI